MVPSPRHNDDSLTYFIASLQGPLVVNPAGRQVSTLEKKSDVRIDKKLEKHEDKLILNIDRIDCRC